MKYDSVKNILASLIRKFPFLRIFFYKALDLIFLRSWYVRNEIKRIRKNFGNQEIKILDAGTGYGQYTYFMSKKLLPCGIKAIDIKDDWIKDCRIFFGQKKIENVIFETEDLTQIKYENEFDLIICVDVMEHIQNDLLVFQNFYKALKNNGYLLINTPSIFGGSDVHSENDKSFISEHIRIGYSREELEEKLHPIGFSTYQSKYTYGFWGDKAWRLGIKFPMILLNKSKLNFLFLPIYYLLTFPFTLIMMYIDFKSSNKVGSGINFIAKKV
jgi:SAM-dependent methyltransferase